MKKSKYEKYMTMKHHKLLLCCYFSALVLTCFRLKKGRAAFFRPETIVASFLHLMVLFFKVLLNHSSKRQFLVLHWHLLNFFFFSELLLPITNTSHLKKWRKRWKGSYISQYIHLSVVFINLSLISLTYQSFYNFVVFGSERKIISILQYILTTSYCFKYIYHCFQIYYLSIIFRAILTVNLNLFWVTL